MIKKSANRLYGRSGVDHFDVQRISVWRFRASIVYSKVEIVDTNSHTEAAAPSGVNFTHDGTTITVNWTPPSPAPSNGYMVYYTDYYIFRHSARDAGSVSVSSGSDSQVVIPVTDIVYNVSVVAVSDLPSVVIEAVPGTHRYMLPIIHDYQTLQVYL